MKYPVNLKEIKAVCELSEVISSPPRQRPGGVEIKLSRIVTTETKEENRLMGRSQEISESKHHITYCYLKIIQVGTR